MHHRIGFLTDRVHPFYGGGYEMSIYNVSIRLAKLYDVTIYTSMESDSYEIDKVKFVKIARKREYTNSHDVHSKLGSILFYKDLLNNIEIFEGCELLIINTIPYFGFGHIMYILKKKYRIVVLPIFHEAWYDYLQTMNVIVRKILYHEISSIVSNADVIIARSTTTYNSLIENYYANNVKVIPDGIDLKIIDTVRPSESCYDIIYVGRLSSIKHVEDIICALELVKQSMPNIRAVIVGKGEAKSKLCRLIEQKHLENNVIMTGYVNEDRKYALMKSSKIFIMPSEREGFCISALEAMYCGCVPLIAQPNYKEVFGTSDFVKDKETGLVFNLHGISELAELIQSVIQNETLYQFLKVNAKKMSSLYTWDNSASLFSDIISKTLS